MVTEPPGVQDPRLLCSSGEHGLVLHRDHHIERACLGMNRDKTCVGLSASPCLCCARRLGAPVRRASEARHCYGCMEARSTVVVFSWIEATGLMEPAHERQACQLPL